MILFRVLGGDVLDPADPAAHARWDWMQFGTEVWTVGIKIDGLTAVMLFVVTLVAFLVHVFSSAYMHGDPKYWKFFAWLQMFSVVDADAGARGQPAARCSSAGSSWASARTS